MAKDATATWPAMFESKLAVVDLGAVAGILDPFSRSLSEVMDLIYREKYGKCSDT